MSKTADGRRDAAVSRLESLLGESGIIVVEMSRAVDRFGKPHGKPVVKSMLPKFDEYRSEESLALWRETCDLVTGGRFDPNHVIDFDGGFSAWLFDRSQQFWKPTGISATVIDPLGTWLHALRSTGEAPNEVHHKIVESDPNRASQSDLAAVAEKARFVAKTLRREYTAIEKLKRNISEHETENRPGYVLDERYKESLPHVLKIERRQLRKCQLGWHLRTGYANVVAHYAAALFPIDELKNFPETCRRAWGTPNVANWAELENEFHLVAIALELRPAPAKIKPPKAKRGRRKGGVTSDVKRDDKIAHAWNSREHKSYDDLAGEFGIDPSEVKRALDRWRKRMKSPE